MLPHFSISLRFPYSRVFYQTITLVFLFETFEKQSCCLLQDLLYLHCSYVLIYYIDSILFHDFKLSQLLVSNLNTLFSFYSFLIFPLSHLFYGDSYFKFHFFSSLIYFHLSRNMFYSIS